MYVRVKRLVSGDREQITSDNRTIFSVRPFQRSSPIALYCLLEVAIRVSRRLCRHSTLSFSGGLYLTLESRVQHFEIILRQKTKKCRARNYKPLQRSCAALSAPLFLSIRSS